MSDATGTRVPAFAPFPLVTISPNSLLLPETPYPGPETGRRGPVPRLTSSAPPPRPPPVAVPEREGARADRPSKPIRIIKYTK